MIEALFLFVIFAMACFVSNRFLSLPSEKAPEPGGDPKEPVKRKDSKSPKARRKTDAGKTKKSKKSAKGAAKRSVKKKGDADGES